MEDTPKVTKKNGLLSQAIGDELLVFDGSGQQCHLLSSKARALFEQVGSPSFEEAKFNNESAFQQILELGLVEVLDSAPGFQRREFLANSLKVATLPFIASISLPRPAQAASCLIGDCPSGNCCQCGPCDGTSFCMQMVCTASSGTVTALPGNFSCETNTGFSDQDCATAAMNAVPETLFGSPCTGVAGGSGSFTIHFCCTS